VFVERPIVPFHLGFGLGLFLHFADDAVVVRQGAAVIGTPLDGAVSTDLRDRGRIWQTSRRPLAADLAAAHVHRRDTGAIETGLSLGR
jgi:hypothetical protein